MKELLEPLLRQFSLKWIWLMSLLVLFLLAEDRKSCLRRLGSTCNGYRSLSHTLGGCFIVKMYIRVVAFDVTFITETQVSPFLSFRVDARVFSLIDRGRLLLHRVVIWLLYCGITNGWGPSPHVMLIPLLGEGSHWRHRDLGTGVDIYGGSHISIAVLI
jgi:hypothetical protein